MIRRTRQVGMFLRGPIPWWWLQAAMKLPGRALAVGVAAWLQAGLRGTTERLPVNLSRVGVDRSRASRGLAALERAGLVQVERRPGRPPLVTLMMGKAPGRFMNGKPECASVTGAA
ncbi:MAG: hypothetical protein ABI488_05650 [Polyangiaceae bacterium]